MSREQVPAIVRPLRVQSLCVILELKLDVAETRFNLSAQTYGPFR